MVPNCASESPASGDSNLIGNHLKMQEVLHREALRRLAEGTKDKFGTFIGDAGFQVGGNIKRTEDKFTDFREVISDAGGVFLGKNKDFSCIFVVYHLSEIVLRVLAKERSNNLLGF